MATSTRDLTPVDFPPDLDWSVPARVASLDRVVEFVEDQADRSARWYYDKRGTKRFWGYWTRALAMVFAGLGGAVPVVSQMQWTAGDHTVHIQAGWATLFLLMAGGLVLFDRFAGFTSGWVRYIETGQKIGTTLEVFRFDQQQRRVAWTHTHEPGHPGVPTMPQVSEHLDLCRNLLVAVRDIEKAETAQWAKEFRDALEQINLATKAEVSEVSPGGLDVTVTNGADFERGWELSLNDVPQGTYSGTTASRTGLAPRLVVVKVRSVPTEPGQPPRRAEQAVQVAPGQVATATLTLA